MCWPCRKKKKNKGKKKKGDKTEQPPPVAQEPRVKEKQQMSAEQKEATEQGNVLMPTADKAPVTVFSKPGPNPSGTLMYQMPQGVVYAPAVSLADGQVLNLGSSNGQNNGQQVITIPMPLSLQQAASVVSLELDIPSKIQSRLNSGGGRLLYHIADQCGGVHIKFPSDKEPSDKVIIRGPKDDAERAQKLLLYLAKHRELSSFEDSITAKQEFHSLVVGKGGTNIKKAHEMAPSVRILFPRMHDTEPEKIYLIGRKEEVAKIKEQIEKQLIELYQTVGLMMEVDPKWQRHFVKQEAQVLREVQDKFGVIISFPRPGSNESNVCIKGGKEGCDQAKGHIEEIVKILAVVISELSQSEEGSGVVVSDIPARTLSHSVMGPVRTGPAPGNDTIEERAPASDVQRDQTGRRIVAVQQEKRK